MGKVDADAFADLMGSMINAPWLLDYQKEWPKYLFHTTHVENAARIVMDGKLLSRDLALQAGRLGHDTGNQSVLDHQSRHIAKHARLYFRPNTPALFHAEGIRPKGRYKSGSCPVPIAFLFDSAEVLSLDGSRFTNGNTASPKKCAFNSSAYQLAKLPFQLIYHDEGFSQGAGYITFHRHAEVLIPNALDLKSLKKICFRSPSELETFLTLLEEYGATSELLRRTAEMCKVDAFLFSCNFPFVVGGELTPALTSFSVHWGFNPELKRPIAFEALATWTTAEGSGSATGSICLERMVTEVQFPTPVVARSGRVLLTLELDGQLGFAKHISPATP